MNRACTACGQRTIGQKWLVYATFLPVVFLFIQIRCGRCQQEQVYELTVPWLLKLVWELAFPILLVALATYLAIWLNFNGWLIILVALLCYLVMRGIKLYFLLKKYP